MQAGAVPVHESAHKPVFLTCTGNVMLVSLLHDGYRDSFGQIAGFPVTGKWEYYFFIMKEYSGPNPQSISW